MNILSEINLWVRAYQNPIFMGYEIKEASLIKEKKTEIVFHDGDNLYPLSALKKE